MKKVSLIFTVALLAASCNDNNKKSETETTQTDSIAMEETQETNEWRELFNGEDLEGWKAYNSDGEPTQW